MILDFGFFQTEQYIAMNILSNRLLLGTLGLILISLPSFYQSQSLPSPFSGSADKFAICSGVNSEGMSIQPYELAPERPSTFLSHTVQEAVLSTAIPLQPLNNPAKLLEHADATYLDYFSRPPPQFIIS